MKEGSSSNHGTKTTKDGGTDEGQKEPSRDEQPQTPEASATEPSTREGVNTHPEGIESIGKRGIEGKVKKIQIECVNITNLAYNWHASTSREADVIFVQEHKLRGKTLSKVKEELDKEGWSLMCGPCDMNTAKPNAGVGVLVRKEAGIKVTRGKI